MKTLLSLVALLIALSCRDNNPTPKDLPSCIQEAILQINKGDVKSPPVQIYQYTYQKKRVYYVVADCCDQYNFVLSEQCDTLCAPDGGFSGRGDGRCPNFSNEAKDRVLVWETKQGK